MQQDANNAREEPQIRSNRNVFAVRLLKVFCRLLLYLRLMVLPTAIHPTLPGVEVDSALNLIFHQLSEVHTNAASDSDDNFAFCLQTIKTCSLD